MSLSEKKDLLILTGVIRKSYTCLMKLKTKKRTAKNIGQPMCLDLFSKNRKEPDWLSNLGPHTLQKLLHEG